MVADLVLRLPLLVGLASRLHLLVLGLRIRLGRGLGLVRLQLLDVREDDATVLARAVQGLQLALRDLGLVRLVQSAGGDVELISLRVLLKQGLYVLQNDASVLARANNSSDGDAVLVRQLQRRWRDGRRLLLRGLKQLVDVRQSIAAILARASTFVERQLCPRSDLLSLLACKDGGSLLLLGQQLCRKQLALRQSLHDGLVLFTFTRHGQREVKDRRELLSRGRHVRSGFAVFVWILCFVCRGLM